LNKARIFPVLLILMLIGGCALRVVRRDSVPLYVHENARELVKLVNRYRVRNGLHMLEWDGYLYFICLNHAQDMRERGYFSHYSPDYLGPFDRLRSARVEYVYAGENIAHGQLTPEKVLSDWLHSPSHRRNIESALYTHHAVAYDPVGNYWTHMFVNYGTGYYMISGFNSTRRVGYRTRN